MAKSAGPGRCVHCLREVRERNWDHVFPASWYPATTPLNMEKWQVPSCIECNKEYGKIEEDLLTRFGLCLDPDHPDTEDVVKRMLRSMKPEYGRNPRDRRVRGGKQRKILGKTITFQELPSYGILPNFGPVCEPDPGLDGHVGILVSKYSLERLAEKIVRGATFIENGIYIDGSYEFGIYFLEDGDAAHIVEMIDKFGVQLGRGPGLLIRRAVIPEDKQSGLYVIEIWGVVKLYVAVMPKELNSNSS